mmetsp:Transcript_74715/g.178262  ORF Transcript_74715/g.178262 Transcript_74715/m.178262 type:complete len:132 (+) Transcript_74715:2205-2600(+)
MSGKRTEECAACLQEEIEASLPLVGCARKMCNHLQHVQRRCRRQSALMAKEAGLALQSRHMQQWRDQKGGGSITEMALKGRMTVRANRPARLERQPGTIHPVMLGVPHTMHWTEQMALSHRCYGPTILLPK